MGLPFMRNERCGDNNKVHELVILSVLRSEGDAPEKLQQMCDRLSELYEDGHQPCLFAILLLGSARDVFHAQVKALFCTWINAVANVLIETGVEIELAKQQGANAAIAIHGSLILSQALDDPSSFQRMIQQLPRKILKRERR